MRKGFAIIIAVMLLLSASSVVIGAGDGSLVWNALDMSLEGGLEYFEYNGEVYIGYNRNEAYLSKDTKSWEKVFSAKDSSSSPLDITDLYLVGDGTAFMLCDATGLYYKSMDGIKWVKAPKEEGVKEATSSLYRDGYLYVMQEGMNKSFPVEGIGEVKKVKLINDMLLIFSKDLQDSTHNLVHYAELKGEVRNRVVVKGKELVLDIEPQMIEDRLLLPFRAVVEALDGEVSWDESTQTVDAKKGDITITLQIDNLVAKVNGVDKRMDVPARIVNNRTLVPVRFVSESLRAEVVWDYMQSKAVISFKAPELVVSPENGQQDGGTAPQVPVVIPTTPPSGGNSGEVEKEALRQQIIGKYTAEANVLRDEGLSRIGDIINHAKSEYDSLPENEKSSDAKMSIYLKYLSPASQVEQDTKARFDSIIEQMRQELVANNLPIDAVQVANDEYQQQRMAKINELMGNL